MKRLVLAVLLLSALASGCSSGNKSNRPSGKIAADVETEFRQRWIAKRMTELQNTDNKLDAREARRLASAEFRDRFAHTTIAKKADPLVE